MILQLPDAFRAAWSSSDGRIKPPKSPTRLPIFWEKQKVVRHVLCICTGTYSSMKRGVATVYTPDANPCINLPRSKSQKFSIIVRLTPKNPRPQQNISAVLRPPLTMLPPLAAPTVIPATIAAPIRLWCRSFSVLVTQLYLTLNVSASWLVSAIP